MCYIVINYNHILVWDNCLIEGAWRVFMDNELQKKKTGKKEKDGSLNTILFSSLAIILLLLAELFLMIMMPQMLSAIAAIGVVIVGCAYVDLSTCMKRIQKKEEEQEELYASMLKSEKASYLLIRKYFDEIEEQMALMEEKFSEPFQGVIAAQKATAKVTINRNKENAGAIMSSNDKLMEQVMNLKSKVEELSESISEVVDEREKNQNTTLLQKQTEMSNQMRELELSLRNEILQVANKLSSVSPQVVMAAPQMMPVQQPVAAPVTRESQLETFGDLDSLNELGGLGDIPDFTPLDAVEDRMPEPSFEDSEPIIDEPVMEPELEPVVEPVTEELPPMPDLSDPNRDMSPDEIDALLANINAEAEAMPEPEAEPEPVTEELPSMPDLSDPNKMMSPDDIAALLANMNAESSVVAEEEAAEPEPIPEPEPEPVVEELPPMPDLSDPNKMMSPDDIAALLANMTAESSVVAEEDAVVEPEPEPVVEELPPMPDLSDPNRQMTPEEIAALFANMG